MTRNKIRLLSVALVMASALYSINLFVDKPISANTGTQPNIILIVTDDQRADTVSYMPKISALASLGTTFTNSFMTTPLCCPSRSSILTGQYAHNHGVLANDPGFSAFQDTSTLATWLHDAGYNTALVGKYLNNYNPSSTDPYIPPGWDTFLAFHQPPKYYSYTLTNYINGVKGTAVSYGSTTAEYSTDVLADKAVDYINATEANDDQPFFLEFTPYASHKPFTPAKRHRNAFADIAPYRPPSFNEQDVSDKPSWVKSLPVMTTNQIATLDKNRKNILRSLLAVDEAVEKIKNTLVARGELENTVIIFLGGDNGYHWGEHRIQAGKNSPYEESIRNMTIVFDGRNQIPQVNSSVVLNIDLAPTIMELAGEPIPATVDGNSFVPLLTNQAVTWRPDFLIENFGTNVAGKFKGVRSSDNKVYIEYPNGEKELYDLNIDPYQLVNIVTDPAQASLISAMQVRLQQLVTCQQATCQ